LYYFREFEDEFKNSKKKIKNLKNGKKNKNENEIMICYGNYRNYEKGFMYLKKSLDLKRFNAIL
jgi:hypothetical protein